MAYLFFIFIVYRYFIKIFLFVCVKCLSQIDSSLYVVACRLDRTKKEKIIVIPVFIVSIITITIRGPCAAIIIVFINIIVVMHMLL